MPATKYHDIHKKNSHEIVKELERLAKIDHHSTFNLKNHQEVQVSLRPREEIPPAIFHPDPLFPGGFLAHPRTIEALRKEIFMVGTNIDELSAPYTCHSCRHQLDLQFWHFCPYCGARFN